MTVKETSNDSVPVSMSKTQKLRKWVIRLTVFLTVLGPLIFLIAAIGAKIGLWGWQFGLLTLSIKLAPLVLIAAGATGVLCLALGLIIKPRKGFIPGILALIVPVFFFVQLMGMKSLGAANPIHDITTDTQNVPVFSEAILNERAKTPSVNTVEYAGKTVKQDGKDMLVSAFQSQTYKDIKTVILTDPPDVVFGKAKAAANALNWRLVSEDLDSGIIEATDTTFWYGFKDDIVIRVQPGKGGGAIVDIRSISRVGRSDLGANAKRIRAFTKIMTE